MNLSKENKINICCYSFFGLYAIITLAVFGYGVYFLQKLSFSYMEIGMTIGISALLASIIQPIIGKYADARQYSWKNILIALNLIYLIASLGVFIAPKNVLIVLFGIMVITFGCMYSFINQAVFYYENKGIQTNFGVSRGFGSLTYMIFSSVIGVLLAYTNIMIINAFSVIGAILMILVLYLAPYYGSIIENDKNYKNKTNDENDLGRNNLNSENETNDENDLESSHNLDSENELNDGNKLNGKNNEYDYSKDKSKFKNSVLLKYPIFTLVFLSVTFLMIFHNIFTGYMISFFENVGGNISDVALGNSIAAFLELPTMFLFAKFLKKVSAQKLLIIASIFYFLRSILVFTAQDTLGIYISITLQMLSFALMIPASVHITDELMREEDKYEGQAYMGVTQTIGIIFANLIGGNILQLYGVDFLTSLLLIISFLGCLFALSTVVANRRIKN